MSSRSTTSRRSGRSQPAAPNLDADFPPLHPSTQPPSKAKLPIKINDLIVGPLGRPDAPTSRRRTRPDTPSTQPSSAFQPSKKPKLAKGATRTSHIPAVSDTPGPSGSALRSSSASVPGSKRLAPTPEPAGSDNGSSPPVGSRASKKLRRIVLSPSPENDTPTPPQEDAVPFDASEPEVETTQASDSGGLSDHPLRPTRTSARRAKANIHRTSASMRVPDALEPLLESDVSHSSDAYSPPPEAAAQKGKGKAVTHLISDSSSDTDDAPAMSESDLEPKQKTRKPAPQKGQSGPAATAPKMLRTATTYSLTLKAKTSLKVMSAKHLRDQREGNDVIAASDAMQDVATELNYLATGEQFEEQAATGETRFKSATLRLLKNGWRQTAVSKFLTIIAQNSEYIRYDGYALEQRLGGHS